MATENGYFTHKIRALGLVQGELLKGSLIDNSVKDFVSAVLDKSTSIGVRGDFTNEYLQKLGFSAVETIGCPSMYMNGPDIRIERKVETLSAESKIAVNITNRQFYHVAKLLNDLKQLYQKSIYVPQDIDDARLMLWGKPRKEHNHEDMMPSSLFDVYYKTGDACFFTDVYPWLQFMRGMDFSIGTRIHGNVFALLAGTPAFLIAHDSRTLELAEYFKIPHKASVDITEQTIVDDLYQQADYGPLMNGHPERFKKYVDFLEKNELRHIWDDSTLSEDFDRKLSNVEYQPSLEVLGHSGNYADRIAALHAMHELKVDALLARIKKLEGIITQMGAAFKRK